jgi:hypothetical protein
VFAGQRIHGDDTTVPVFAKVKTRTGRLWTYVRDDQPFGGKDPPAAVFFYSADRTAIHPEQHLAGYTGVLGSDWMRPPHPLLMSSIGPSLGCVPLGTGRPPDVGTLTGAKIRMPVGVTV